MLVTGDQQLLRQINRMVLVRKLLSESELSRADLAEAVGLTKSTVSLLVRELVDEGWFSESELVATTARLNNTLRRFDTRVALSSARQTSSQISTWSERPFTSIVPSLRIH